MPLRVLFLTYHFPLETEPGAFRPLMEARLLKMAGYEVTVVTSGVQYMTGEDIRGGSGWVAEEDVEGIRVLRVWGVRKFRTSLLKRALNYITYSALSGAAAIFKVGGVDRVFAGTDPVFMMPIVYLISLIKRAGLVLDERDLFPETAIAMGVIRDGFVAGLVSRMQRYFRGRAMSILSATPGIRRMLIQYGHAEDKVFMLYNADVFLESGGKTREVAPNIKRITGGDYVVGYAGGLGIVNDVGTLLRAAERLKGVAGLVFVIVGAGEKRYEYENWLKERNVNNTWFLGAYPRDIARDVISQMDVCAVPHPKGEHFGATLTSKIFDYMALGKPVIFTGIGDSADILNASGGGAVIPAGDDERLAKTITRLRDNPDQTSAMGRRARQWYEANVHKRAGVELMRKIMRDC